MESDAPKLRRCANPPGPGRVTVKHWSHLGLTYTPCRPVLEVNLGRETDREDQPFLTRRCSRHRHRHINPKARYTSPAMSIIDRDDGRRGRRGLSCEVRKTTRQHLVVSSKDGRQRSVVVTSMAGFLLGLCMEGQRNQESMM